MCRSRRAKQPGVRLEVEVKFDGVCHVAVDDCAGLAVLTPVCLLGIVRVDGEESHVVPLADHDEGDGGADTQ